MELKYYKAYNKYLSKRPVDYWRDIMQETINDTWENTSTVENVLGQSSLGKKTFKAESVQLNSVIDAKTGASLADEYRKIIYKTLNENKISNTLSDTNRFLGKYYKFSDFTWITINTNTTVGALASAILQRCNNWLRWYDNNGILHEWECVFERNLSSTGLDRGSEGVTEISSDTIVKVQRNSETDLIPYNQRFIFDGHAFQVKQINNHVSKSYMEIYLFETQIQSNDDLINNIANSITLDISDKSSIIISPEMTKLLEGEEQLFSVYKYVNGLKTDDTFSVQTLGPEQGLNYEIEIIDGNHFKIQNTMESNTPLRIHCYNIDNDEENASLNILLGGIW